MCSDTVIGKLRSTEVKLYGALLLDPSEAIKAKIEKKTPCVITFEIDVYTRSGSRGEALEQFLFSSN